MSKTRLAVSIVFVFKDTVYTIVRKDFLRAFPGYTAFPGGKVEKSDGDPNDLDRTLFNTLCREAKEELDINIEQLVKEKKIKSIDKIARAKSPKFNPYIYDTYFYRLELSEKIEFKLDENEMENPIWDTADTFIRDYNFGKRLLIYPIRKVFEKLSENILFSEYLDYSNRDEEIDDIPYVEPMRNFLQLMPESNTLPPASRTNAFVIGDSVKFLIDPSPKDTNEYRAFLKAISKFQLDKIIISHHHADHHQYAPALAKHLSLPIFLSKDTWQRCLDKHGKDYFEGIKIEYLSEGDTVGTWLKQDVKVIEVPGHDEGQLAFMPEKKAWCIVGDLFQGIGTVVVGGEEGDMQKYFHSLQKIIDLAPAAVAPSHGIILGGVYILEKTLKHRKLREEQVFKLYGSGKTIEEILELIYFDLPKNILPYAKANIMSHLDKLVAEGKLVKNE